MDSRIPSACEISHALGQGAFLILFYPADLILASHWLWAREVRAEVCLCVCERRRGRGDLYCVEMKEEREKQREREGEKKR